MIQRIETEIIKNWTCLDSPLLSVICVTYNHEHYIEEALDSILMQETDFPFEVIIHDDCSTDKTRDILVNYADKYPRIIKLILQKENQFSKGIKPAKASIEKSSGKYIAMCEGDDYWIDPKKLQMQLDAMRQFENCQMSFHSAIDKWEDNSRKNGITTRQARGNKLFTVNEIILGGGGFCPTASLILEKEAVLNLPEWYMKAPFGDYFLQIFGSLKGGALYIDRPMSVYRRNTPGSWTGTMQNIVMREKRFEKMMITLDEMDRYFNRRFHTEIRKIESDWYFRMAMNYLKNNNFLKFDQMIYKSNHLADKKSKKLLLSFYFRKFPLLLQSIGSINKYLVSKG